MIFFYEWKHLQGIPVKLVALALFIAAGLYGLHNGAALYERQTKEIEGIRQKAEEQRQSTIAYYEKGEKGPSDRPWVDITIPFWAVWYAPSYHFKTPSPAMVYSIGQAEQYGFYKQISIWSSPYDPDMMEEIANPERLQAGTMDFSFVVLFLLPVLLLILLYNIKGSETEQGLLPLIYVQIKNKNRWLLPRISFYVGLASLSLTALIFYGAVLTNAWDSSGIAIIQVLFYAHLYLILWSVLFTLVLRSGKSIAGNTLQMVGCWMLFAFILPAAVNQWISIDKPANLMANLIDTQRDGRAQIFEQPDSLIRRQLFELLPNIKQSPAAADSTQSTIAMRYSVSALANQLIRNSIQQVEEENQSKNSLIRRSYWFNPVTFFQNQLNDAASTHYQNYHAYRQQVQMLIEKRIVTMVSDTWNGEKVDKDKYLWYCSELSE